MGFVCNNQKNVERIGIPSLGSSSGKITEVYLSGMIVEEKGQASQKRDKSKSTKNGQTWTPPKPKFYYTSFWYALYLVLPGLA